MVFFQSCDQTSKHYSHWMHGFHIWNWTCPSVGLQLQRGAPMEDKFTYQDNSTTIYSCKPMKLIVLYHRKHTLLCREGEGGVLHLPEKKRWVLVHFPHSATSLAHNECECANMGLATWAHKYEGRTKRLKQKSWNKDRVQWGSWEPWWGSDRGMWGRHNVPQEGNKRGALWSSTWQRDKAYDGAKDPQHQNCDEIEGALNRSRR